MKLANGITLIVQPETISDSVFVYGSVKTAPSLQEPVGQEGIARVVEGMYGYGTQTQDRETFQRALDSADTELAGGSSFGMQTTSRSLRSRGHAAGRERVAAATRSSHVRHRETARDRRALDRAQ